MIVIQNELTRATERLIATALDRRYNTNIRGGTPSIETVALRPFMDTRDKCRVQGLRRGVLSEGL